MDTALIEEYRLKDRKDCLRLLKRTFTNADREETFRWRFEQKAMKPLILCARIAGEIVSFAAWIPWTFAFHGELFTGYQIGEAATDIEHRGKGLWTALVTRGTEILKTWKVDFEFAFPNTGAPSYNPLRRGGYTPAVSTPFWIKPLPFPPRKRPARSEDPTIACFRPTSQSNLISPVVDENYIRWRYYENPKNYRIIPIHDNGESACFFLKEKKIKGKIPEAILMDVQFTTEDERFLDRAFRRMSKEAAERSYLIRTFVLKNSPRGLFLAKRFPFHYPKNPMNYFVKNVSGRIPDSVLHDGANWDIMPHLVDDL